MRINLAPGRQGRTKWPPILAACVLVAGASTVLTIGPALAANPRHNAPLVAHLRLNPLLSPDARAASLPARAGALQPQKAAAAGWSEVPSPKPLFNTGDLSSTSCVSSDFCIAVGYSQVAPNIEKMMVAKWNGKKWTSVKVPNPAGVTVAYLSAVSCRSATGCEAVGGYKNSSGGWKLLAEALNGSKWKLQNVPTPTGSNSYPASVSCSSAKECEAVGDYDDKSGEQITLAFGWNGSKWTTQTGYQPALNEIEAATLNSVSCTGNTCQAVGNFENDTDEWLGLSEQWTGSKWVGQTAYDEGNAGTFLYGLACTSAERCEAVGVFGTGPSEAIVYSPLVEIWNGSHWSPQTAAQPSDEIYGELNAVACSGGECEAVGSYQLASGVLPNLVESSDNGNWTLQSSATSVGSVNSTLYSVSCISGVSTCESVGLWENSSGIYTVFGDRFSNSQWSLQSTPNPIGNYGAYLQRASCLSANWCEAVGYQDRYGSDQSLMLAEHWNGKKWTIQSTPDPPNAAGVLLRGIFCTSTHACEAVGDYQDGRNNNTISFAEGWNGSKWTLQTVPNPTLTTDALLSGVSCLSARSCEAIGLGGGALIGYAWDGTQWTAQQSPGLPSNTFDTQVLSQAISCSAGTCRAVGSYLGGSPEGVVMTFKAGNWTTAALPTPAGALQLYVQGIACSGDSCEAVGYYTYYDAAKGDRLEQSGYAAHWNGSKWTRQSVPDPHASRYAYLFGVSCTSSSACIAVGGYQTSSAGDVASYAERYAGGKWSVQSIHRPSGASEDYLAGISCFAALRCIATGTAGMAGGTVLGATGTGGVIVGTPAQIIDGSPGGEPLIERYH